MTLKKNVALAAAMVTAMASTSAWAASENANAEFAAVYSEYPIVLVPYGDREVSNYAYCKAEYLGGPTDATCNFEAERRTGALLTSIKVAQSKELLVGVSAQMEIFTGTTVTGKRGSRSTAIASAGGGVELFACREESDGGATCYGSLSGMVVLSERTQELTAVLGGGREKCSVDLITGNFSLADCDDVAQEEIGLGLSTIASHHYNFLFPNLPVGTYNIHAVFHADAAAEGIAGCADGNGDTALTGCGMDDGVNASAEADAYVVISKSTVTVQEVRAKKAWDLTPIEM